MKLKFNSLRLAAQSFAIATAIFTITQAIGGGDDKVTVKNNGKEIRSLSETLFNKPGSYKKGPNTDMKRAEFGSMQIGTPTAGLDAGDSLKVEVSGLSGNAVLWKKKQHVLAGQAATFGMDSVVTADYNPNGKQPSYIGKVQIDVAPLKRANRGTYQSTIMVK